MSKRNAGRVIPISEAEEVKSVPVSIIRYPLFKVIKMSLIVYARLLEKLSNIKIQIHVTKMFILCSVPSSKIQF